MAKSIGDLQKILLQLEATYRPVDGALPEGFWEKVEAAATSTLTDKLFQDVTNRVSSCTVTELGQLIAMIRDLRERGVLGAPTEKPKPIPVEPQPDPKPTPVDPVPVDPAPIDPAPVPVDPAPAPVDPAPADPAPVEPADPQPVSAKIHGNKRGPKPKPKA